MFDLSLAAPDKQPHRAEAGGEEGESAGKRGRPDLKCEALVRTRSPGPNIGARRDTRAGKGRVVVGGTVRERIVRDVTSRNEKGARRNVYADEVSATAACRSITAASETRRSAQHASVKVRYGVSGPDP
jgi:hypothetical protein